MKKHLIPPFCDPLNLEGISVENAEEIIELALANCPGTSLYAKNFIDTTQLRKGQKVVRQEVKIEQIGNEL